jgi:cytidyltransferase-like protein
MNMAKQVFVSGCYDLLHSGHVMFFQKAAEYGDLTVALGSDKTIYELKGHTPINSEQERRYMVKSMGIVKDAFISSGSGVLDFEQELRARLPDIFIVNEDGNIPQKRALCAELDIDYVVLQREPHEDLTPRSTTVLRNVTTMPYRIDIAGGWLDQPFVSKLCAGSVITVSIEPTVNFNERSGMATSTRNSALDLWGPRLPSGDPEKLAQILFRYDNPPGSEFISGSQDSIGIVVPGVVKSYYTGSYWPQPIDTIRDETTYQFIEDALYLIPLDPRTPSYNPLMDTHITEDGARALANATDACWGAIQNKDIEDFGLAIRNSFEAQIRMFPNMVNQEIQDLIDQYCDQTLGWKLSGAGGGGYLIFVAQQPLEHAVRVTLRRENGVLLQKIGS